MDPIARALVHTSVAATRHPQPLTRISRGAFVVSDEWSQLLSEGRLRTRAFAVAQRCSTPDAAFSHWTAAALHGLPAYRVRTDRVDLIVPGEHTRKNSKDVFRHQLPLAEDDVILIDGLRVTALERTVYDAIRTATVEAALACFDAALRAVAWDARERSYDVERAEAFRNAVAGRISSGTGARGIRQARFVCSFADGRAQLPGESIARLWTMLLGIPAPELQLRIARGGGRFALLDFSWPTLQRWAEFDGMAKYDDPDMRQGRSREEVLADPLARERDIVRITGWRVDRFGFDQLASIGVFAAYLRSIRLLR